MDPHRINEIVLGKRSVTENAALRLACYFKTSPQFWMSLQAQYQLDVEGVEEWKGGRLEERKDGRLNH